MCLAAPVPTTTPADAAGYVRPLDWHRIETRLKALPPASHQLVEMYLEAARRDVLSVSDGCFPDLDYRYHYRNLGERAKGAAVLSSLDSFWPEDLRKRCRKEATAFVREAALAHRAKPNFGYEWQAAYVAAESGIAAWFLWEGLDAELREAIAQMVIFQADRFIDATPKMGYRGDTQAETVSWNTSILTLAVNMMPDHPHRTAWDRAAKRYLYNTFATPQDATDQAPGDDGQPIRQWVVGANLYPDLTLENHNQFHIDYVLCSYRYHIQGAALYWLSGNTLPRAFHHHARDLYEKIMLHCMTADGFFAYVSDNDWKRYHGWAESCAIHAYLALLEQYPLAATLEKRALENAMSMWRAFPPDFAYDNPYVCGKAWTSRIADAVLMHIASPDPLPEPLSAADTQAALQGTSRLETPELLTHYASGGSYVSCCKGRDGVWVPYVAPRADAWMILPSSTNYQARIQGQPVIQQATTHWKRGPNWFWVVRGKKSTGSSEAFVSLPDGSAVYVQHLAAEDLPKAGEVENAIMVEKPHCPMSIYYDEGQADWRPGQQHWQRSNHSEAPPVPGRWLNLRDRFGLAVCSASSDVRSEIRLPKPGARDAIRIGTTPTVGAGQNLWVVVWPDQNHADTQARSRQASAGIQGHALVLRMGEIQVAFSPNKQSKFNLSEASSGSPPEPIELEPDSIHAWCSNHRLF